MSSAPGQYLALVTKEEGSDWNIVFPDLPGCVTAGRSLDEAVAFAEEALRCTSTACGRTAKPRRRHRALRT